jgi:hypothetical protein
MKTYEIKFTSGLKLYVQAETEEEAVKIAERWNKDPEFRRTFNQS